MENIVMSGSAIVSEEEYEPAVVSRPAMNHRIHARTLHDVTRYVGADPVFIDSFHSQNSERNGTTSP